MPIFCYKNSAVQRDMEIFDADVFNVYKNARVLITGVTGMLATYIAYAMMYLNDTKSLNISVVGLARNRKKAEERFFDLVERPDFSLLIQDVTQPVTDEEGFDYIFHLAGSASAAAIVSSPQGIIAANVAGTGNILELAAAKPGTKVFFASTREVYGKTDSTVIKEDDIGILNPLSVRSCYPESKRMAENLCAVYNDKYGVNVAIGRIAHSYGPGMQLEGDGRIMADLISNAVKGEDITLKSDGSAKRAFCYISDAVAAVLMAAGRVSGLEVYNIANEKEEISIKDLAAMIAGMVPGVKVAFTLPDESAKKAYFNIERVSLSTEKIEKLGWKPVTGLEEGIKRTIEVMI